MSQAPQESKDFSRTPKTAVRDFLNRSNVPVNHFPEKTLLNKYVRSKIEVLEGALEVLGAASRNDFYARLARAARKTKDGEYLTSLLIHQSTMLELAVLVAKGHEALQGIDDDRLRETLKGKIEDEERLQNPAYQLKYFNPFIQPEQKRELLEDFKKSLFEGATPTPRDISRK